MKTSIFITGGISGNFRLKLSCTNFDLIEFSKLNFNGFRLDYPTKKLATKALSEAFQFLKSDEPDFFKQGGISYTRGFVLNYDASHAKILPTY